MARAWPLAALAVLLSPAVAACTTTGGPSQAVRFVATEGGRTLLDLPTAIRVGPSPSCGVSVAPPLAFDGRFAAWDESGPRGLHVVDLETDTVETYPSGVLTQGHLALLGPDGARPTVTLVDLANGTSRTVDAPAGQGFAGNFEGAVVAVDAIGGDSGHLSVLNPVTGAWRLQDVAAPAAGHLDVPLASRDWVILSQPGTPTGVWSLEVASGRTAPVADAQGHLEGLRGDRLHLSSLPSSYGSGSFPQPTYPPGDRFWSVQLPGGGDRKAGPMPAPAPLPGNRTVSFRIVETGTQLPPSSSALPGNTPPATTADAATAGSRAAFAATGVSILGVLALGALVRRRLP